MPSWAELYVDEGRRDDRFGALCDGDTAGRAFALACMSLAHLETLDPSAREVLYRRIATEPRGRLLAELAGANVSAAAVRALGRVAATEFTADDWRHLFNAYSRTEDARALGHVTPLTPALVRQYDAIPVELRAPRLLAVAARVRVSDARWRRLGETLAQLLEDVRTSLVREARAVKSVGELWDYVFRCRHALEEAMPFPVEQPKLGPLFKPLATAEAMRREGREMSNCMARCVRKVLEGQAVYYRWIGAETADFELLRVPGGRWSAGMMAGPGNSALSTGTKDAILRAVRQALRDGFVAEEGAGELDPAPAPGIARAEAVGRQSFTSQEIGSLADGLRLIRGRSVASDNGAYCIVEVSPGVYVQFLARTDRPWLWSEFSSHRFVPAVEAYLTDDAVGFIEDCHFSWPLAQGNFAGSLPCRTDEDCEGVAAFALGALAILFGYAPGSPHKIQVHVPKAAPQASA